MKLLQFVLLIVSLTISSNCQNVNFNQTTKLWSGERIDGDKLIGIQHKMSQFFTEPSSFEFLFDFNGGNTNITYFEVNTRGVRN
jgi:hypothetical protein